MGKRQEFYFDSRDGLNRIHAVSWIPDQEEPTFILQIVHGMAEYVECYDYFANYMAERGVLVVAQDHLGHGKSVGEGGVYGYFCKTDPATVVVRDVHRLKKLTQEKYPGVPYFVLGHSMGSFILRNYLCRYGKGIDGAVIAGTGNQPDYALVFGKGLVRSLAVLQGWKHKSGLLNAIVFGRNNRRVKEPRTVMDWLTRDVERVDRYMADSKCGFTFTLNGFYALFELIHRVHKRENLEKMPCVLPLLLAAGTEDPVGNYGIRVRELYDSYIDLGMQKVEISLYEGSRHEIINEIDKEKVFQEIYEWLKKTRNELER